MKLTVIIPIYNEKDTCQSLIKKVQLVPIEKQVIVVDDSSTDGSREILEKIDDIELLKHDGNLGKGSAIQTAVPHIQGDYVILQDGDLEYAPEDYQSLLKPILNKEADVVFGSRWLNKNNKWTFHFIGNRLLTTISNIINFSWINDLASCYKIFPTSIFKSLNLKSKGFGLEAEIVTKCIRKKYRILEIPISYNRRSINEGKKIRLKDGIVALWSIFRFRFFD